MTDVLWVSQDAPSNGNGSIDQPFKDIQSAIDAAQPGTTIHVKAGEYIENLDFSAGGAPGAPITLVSIDGPNAAVIRPKQAGDDTIQIDGHDYITITGFELHGSADDSRQVIHIHAVQDNTNGATHIEISNNTIYRGEGDGIKISKSSDILISNNTVIGGGDKESGIDIVGGARIILDGNTLSDLGHIGFMIKGGSRDIAVLNNTITNAGKNAIEVGGYSNLGAYPPGFLDAGYAFEAFNVLVEGNVISGTDEWALRLIGAQSVTVSGNTFEGSSKQVRINDSDKYHEPWYADDLGFFDNSFETEHWLEDRGDRAEITFGEDALQLFQWWPDVWNPSDTEEPVSEPVPDPAPEEPLAPPPDAPEEDPVSPPQDDTGSTPDADPVDDTPPEVDPVGYEVTDGTNQDDRLDGSSADDAMYGFAGDDELDGRGGNDLLEGGDGRDKLLGGQGDDGLFGGAGDDELRGEAGADFLSGMEGEDLLRGDDGDDTLDGGLQDDRLEGGDGNDLLKGGDGDDEIRGGKDMDVLFGDDGRDRLEGDEGDDMLFGMLGDDELKGGKGNDTLDGGSGDDRLESGEDDDVLEGGAGNDDLRGGKGNDTLEGGFGNDTLEGGDHNDTFVFRADVAFGTDFIKDFDPADDVLVLLGFSAIQSFGDLDTNNDGQLTGLDDFISKSGNNVEIDLSSQYGAADGTHVISLEADTVTADYFAFMI